MRTLPALALLAVPGFALLRLVVPPGAEALSVDARLPALAAADHPPLTLWLAALLDGWPGPRGSSGADGVTALTVSASLALLFPWRARHAVALTGLLLAALAGPATSLLCLLCLLLWRGLGRSGVGGLVAIGFALALMPLVHGAGAAMAIAMLPVIATVLPAPLVAGRAMTGALMIIGFPVLVSVLGQGAMAVLFQGSTAAPYASLAGSAVDDAGIIAWLRGGALALPALFWCGVTGLRHGDGPSPLMAFAPLVAGLIHGLGGGDPCSPALTAAPALALAGAVTPDESHGKGPAIAALILAATASGLFLAEPPWTFW